jgi:hypothetical protein
MRRQTAQFDSLALCRGRGGLASSSERWKFLRTGKKLSDEAMRDLGHSKRWKQRYSKFLPKLILPGAMQRHRLKLWIKEFKDSKDPASGKPALTRNTEKVATE